ALAHGLVPAVTTPADSRRYIRHLLEFDPLGGVVAEEDDRIVGVGWVHPRGAVATLGPLAVDPGAQGRGIGRRLLERAVELAGKGLPQVRLVQESFNAVSLGLYLPAGYAMGIGFEGVAHLGSAAADDAEVLLCLAGTVASELAAQGHRVRTMVPAADRRLVEGLMGFGFRVFRACHYMVRGGGTAPP